MSHNRLCKVCGISFEVPGSQDASKLKNPCCSEKCMETARKKKKKCGHGCREQSLRFRRVTFKDKTVHIQQYCLRCLKTTFLGKGLIPPSKLEINK